MTKPKRIPFEVVFVNKDDSRLSVRILVDATSTQEAIELARHDAPLDWVALQCYPKGQPIW